MVCRPLDLKRIFARRSGDDAKARRTVIHDGITYQSSTEWLACFALLRHHPAGVLTSERFLVTKICLVAKPLCVPGRACAERAKSRRDVRELVGIRNRGQ